MGRLTKTDAEEKKLMAFAERALQGTKASKAFCAVWDEGDSSVVRMEFLLQLGYFLTTDRPIIVACPHGTTLPKKLAAVTDHVIHYDPQHPEAMAVALSDLLVRIGVKPQ